MFRKHLITPNKDDKEKEIVELQILQLNKYKKVSGISVS